ncbi:uncharacterized protein F5147DRAFT_105348 [Suillus discolor]|uniref:Uncharacterized protein n=1 Tax=Suillus discolor TaxID=1912936 RepID=A0A9P7JVU6_9AGAM|nr:uncharacterized protein F5147DRAFT_105348 [Suillus discolor]KAG2110824.1 hypothetical protein F5147DRAFT_105348 [Suillus discolor]
MEGSKCICDCSHRLAGWAHYLGSPSIRMLIVIIVPATKGEWKEDSRLLYGVTVSTCSLWTLAVGIFCCGAVTDFGQSALSTQRPTLTLGWPPAGFDVHQIVYICMWFNTTDLYP